jgi:hypothetical protein
VRIQGLTYLFIFHGLLQMTVASFRFVRTVALQCLVRNG